METLSHTRAVAAVLLLFLLPIVLIACGGSAVESQSTDTVVQPPSEWTKYVGQGAEIYLPPMFDLNIMDPKTLRSPRVSELLGPDAASFYQDQISLLESLGQPYRIIVLASQPGPGSRSTTVMVDEDLTFPVPASVPLRDYVDARMLITSGAGWTEPDGAGRTSLTVDGYEASLLRWESAEGGARLDAYVKGPSSFWSICFVCGSPEMKDRQADFERSISTFNILP